MGVSSSSSRLNGGVLPLKEAQTLLGPHDMAVLEAGWRRMSLGQKLDAKTFQRALFSSFVSMVRGIERIFDRIVKARTHL